MIKKNLPREGYVFEKVGGPGRLWIVDRFLDVASMPLHVVLRRVNVPKDTIVVSMDALQDRRFYLYTK